MLGLLGHVKVGNSLEVGNKQQLPVSVHFRGMSATQNSGHVSHALQAWFRGPRVLGVPG